MLSGLSSASVQTIADLVPFISKQSPWCQQNVMEGVPSHSIVMLVSYSKTALAVTKASSLGLGLPPGFNP